MTIAVLERFGDPSRRCDPETLGVDGADIEMWDLRARPAGEEPSLRELARVIPDWLRGPVPLRTRVRLLSAALRSSHRLRRALVSTPAWAERIHAGHIDEVAYFSRQAFPLAAELSALTRQPGRELLEDATKYLGEFGYELAFVIPYAYWLHEQGRLRATASTADTRCLYYFSPHHRELPVDRRWVPVTEYPAQQSLRLHDAGLPAHIDTSQWRPPPYRDVYSDSRFRWEKPPVIVNNKTSEERYLDHDGPVNHLDVPTLLDLIDLLRADHTVIYNRPRRTDIVGDHASIREPGDIEAVRAAFPDVVTMQELHAAHPNLSFNELQLRVFAGCERFVSVLGGSSYLASYFGGTNVVYARQGLEVDCGAFENWFSMLSGARIIVEASTDGLLAAISREFIGSGR